MVPSIPVKDTLLRRSCCLSNYRNQGSHLLRRQRFRHTKLDTASTPADTCGRIARPSSSRVVFISPRVIFGGTNTTSGERNQDLPLRRSRERIWMGAAERRELSQAKRGNRAYEESDFLEAAARWPFLRPGGGVGRAHQVRVWGKGCGEDDGYNGGSALREPHPDYDVCNSVHRQRQACAVHAIVVY
jgi:hypothetical protein